MNGRGNICGAVSGDVLRCGLLVSRRKSGSTASQTSSHPYSDTARVFALRSIREYIVAPLQIFSRTAKVLHWQKKWRAVCRLGFEGVIIWHFIMRGVLNDAIFSECSLLQCFSGFLITCIA